MANKKQTSPKVATLASKVLRSKKASKEEKTLAGADLAQARGKSKKKK